jgi:signal transduction histidine kinase
MKKDLRLLMLEDEPLDAELIQRYLRGSGLDFEALVVSDKAAFEAALSEGGFDAVLADNSLPQFNSVEALRILLGSEIDVPFILVTGTVSEEFAVDIIQKGADDYILKSNLVRLPASITGALENRRIKREKLRAERDILQMNLQLRELSAHLQNVREEERIQIARDIHDELGQQLTGLKMEVFALSQRISEEGEAFGEVVGLIDKLVGSVRKIASNLRPPLLDDFGLGEALIWQSREIAERFGIKVQFVSGLQEDVVLPVGLSTGLFRIYQEALTNVVRHAGARSVEGSVRLADQVILLEIMDDGKGMDVESSEKKKSLGLLGIKERVYVLGGQLELDSAPGKGTRLLVSIPL